MNRLALFNLALLSQTDETAFVVEGEFGIVGGLVCCSVEPGARK